MSISTSVLSDLLKELPQLQSQIYFKASLTALSHAMEDQVLAFSTEQPLLIASFQSERFYRQEAHRYRRIAQRTDQLYVLAAPETDFTNASEYYETVAFDPEKDALSHEWHLVVIAQHYATCLVCRERPGNVGRSHSLELPATIDMDSARQFEGVWSSAREVTCKAADLLLERILIYRPELESKIEQARYSFGLALPQQRQASVQRKRSSLAAKLPNRSEAKPLGFPNIDTDPFVQRLVTYLQAGQYKLLKAYGSIAVQERKERLVTRLLLLFDGATTQGNPYIRKKFSMWQYKNSDKR
jgi:DICT domain-containing protein